MVYLIELVDKYGMESLLYSPTLKEAQFYCEKLLESNKDAKSLELIKIVGKSLVKKYI